MKVYALKNCDTCRKALRWLDEQKLGYEVHDVRDDGLTEEIVRPLVNGARDKIINRRSTTWRTLSGDEQTSADDADSAVALIVEHPTLMKRPVFVSGLQIYVGFDDGTKLALSEA